jgi:hypothetical protein
MRSRVALLVTLMMLAAAGCAIRDAIVLKHTVPRCDDPNGTSAICAVGDGSYSFKIRDSLQKQSEPPQPPVTATTSADACAPSSTPPDVEH